MAEPSLFVNITTLAILIVISGLTSASEIALVSLSRIKVRTLLKRGVRGSEPLNRLKKNSRRMIITILIINNVVNVAAAAIATLIATEKFGSSGIGIATGVMTLLILVFGEIAPKTFAMTRAETISLIVARPLEILSYVLYPIVVFLDVISDGINKLAGVRKMDTITKEEMVTMTEYSLEKGVIGRVEKDIIDGALRLGEKKAYDMMTHFNKFFSLDGSMLVEHSLEKIVRSGFSKIPIYEKSLENITGIVLIKDVMDAVSKKEYGKRLSDISVDPIFVPKDSSIVNLINIFKENQNYIVLVKSGESVVGLVTVEDLMEEFVGDVAFQLYASPETIIYLDKNTIVAHGDTTVKEINGFFNVSLPSKWDDFNLNELIEDRLKKKPKKHERVVIDGLTLVLEDVKEGKALKIRIMKAAGGEKEEN